MKRLLDKYKKTNNGCNEFTGSTRNGYGIVTYKNKKIVYVNKEKIIKMQN